MIVDQPDNHQTQLYGQELKELLASKGLSQKELANRSGVDQPTISLACTATRALSPENQRKVAHALQGEHEHESQQARTDRHANKGLSNDTDPAVRFVAGQRQKVDYPPGGTVRSLQRSLQTAYYSDQAKASDSDGGMVEVHGLKNWRASKQLNQSELARRTGINRATVSQIEKRGTATQKSARMLASALGITLEELRKSEQCSRFSERRSAHSVSGSSIGASSAAQDADRQPGSAGAHEPIQTPTGEDQPVGAEARSVAVPGLRYCREHRGLSQKTLADSAGMPANSVGRIEKRGRAATDSANALARVLEVSLEDLANPDPHERLVERSQPDAGSRPAESEGKRISSREERVSADSSVSGSSRESEPLRIEVSEQLLKRVDRVLDILEALLGGRVQRSDKEDRA